MKKLLYFLLALAAIPFIAWGVLVATGTVSSNSFAMLLNVMTGRTGAEVTEVGVRDGLETPAGFGVALFANDLPKARFLRFTAAGDLLVSRPHAGDIVLLEPDRDGDGRSDGRSTVITGLDRPQGMDFHDGYLYVAEREQIGRVAFDADAGATRGSYETVVTGLTGDGNHWSKTLRFGPDGLMYLAQGSTCNVCEEADERRATMMRFNPDGSQGTIIATGLRNSVGFDWAPWNNGLYATDNGRDLLGDDYPPCELNLVEENRFYGWPYFNGDNDPDPDMGPDPLADRRSPTAPVHGFRAHNAPLGITFPDTTGWPGNFQRIALVALHGSWNRSEPDGYKVVSLHFDGNSIAERPFLDGFNRDGKISGRPVDVAQGPDGAIYVSDDFAGAIYRLAAEGGAGLAPAGAAAAASRLDSEPPAWLADADLAAMAAEGAALYAQHDCASCHEGGESPVSLAGLSGRLGYEAVIDTLRAPRPPMPIAPLSDLEQRAVAVYLLQSGD